MAPWWAIRFGFERAGRLLSRSTSHQIEAPWALCWPGRLTGGVCRFDGTGCTLSSGIAAGLAHGWPVLEAVAAAKAYLTEGLRAAFPVGQGHGPPSHLFAWWAGGGADGRGGATHAARRETL